MASPVYSFLHFPLSLLSPSPRKSVSFTHSTGRSTCWNQALLLLLSTQNPNNMQTNQLPAALLISFLLAVTACNQPAGTGAAMPPSPDSLIRQWNNAWNQHDSATLAQLFHEESVVIFNNRLKFPGRDSIMNGWIGPNLSSVANLKTVKISSGATDGMAWYTGDYTLDMLQNDSLVAQDVGLFTTIWKKDQSQQWKIEVMQFGVVAKEGGGR